MLREDSLFFGSTLFKARTIELQRPAILCHGTNNIVRRTGWNLGINFNRDLYIRIKQAREMGNHRTSYRIRVPGQPGGAQ